MAAQETTPLLQTQNEVSIVTRGLGVPMATLFVIGTICGLLTIPKAVVNAGWAGVAVLICLGGISAYTGVVLGRCWTILQERYPEYRTVRVTDPYPTIALRAAGKWGQYATRICIDVTLFGAATTSLILISDDISNLISRSDFEFPLCYMLPIVCFCLTPVSWLGTPKDFWPGAVIVAVVISLGALMIPIAVVKEVKEHPPKNVNEHNVTKMEKFFEAFGTIMYSFNGNSIFPTIQVDMREPGYFPLVVTIGMTVVICLYLPGTISGLLLLKDDVKKNIIHSLSASGLRDAINIMITVHILMAFIVALNPVTQQIEGFFGLADRFGWQRVIIRTSYISLVLFAAMSVPQFDVILPLVGGTTIACITFVFPSLFYYLLSRQKSPEDCPEPTAVIRVEDNPQDGATNVGVDSPISEAQTGTSGGGRGVVPWPQLTISLTIRLFLVMIVVIGLVGGVLVTYSSVYLLISSRTNFTIIPCYCNMSYDSS